MLYSLLVEHKKECNRFVIQPLNSFVQLTRSYASHGSMMLMFTHIRFFMVETTSERTEIYLCFWFNSSLSWWNGDGIEIVIDVVWWGCYGIRIAVGEIVVGSGFHFLPFLFHLPWTDDFYELKSKWVFGIWYWSWVCFFSIFLSKRFRKFVKKISKIFSRKDFENFQLIEKIPTYRKHEYRDP